MSVKNYSVSVEPYDGESVNERGGIETWKIYYEAAKLEYEYAHSNSSKLDNKVYILLGVCAFLFPVLHSVRLQAADCMLSWHPYILTFIKLLPLFCLSVAILLLLYLLVTFNVARVNVFNLLQKGEADNDSQLEAERRFAWFYASIRNAGIPKQNRRYWIENTAVIFIMISVFLVMLTVMQQVHSEYSKGGEENMLVNHSADKTDNSVSRMSYDELIDYVARTGNVMPTVPTTQDLMNSKYVHFLGESGDI